MEMQLAHLTGLDMIIMAGVVVGALVAGIRSNEKSAKREN